MPTKKTPQKKAAKAAPKKKASSKKAAPKKAAPKKKASSKKAAPKKKASSKKAAPKKASAKKAAPKKASAKKVAPKKAAPKNASSSKTSPAKAAPVMAAVQAAPPVGAVKAPQPAPAPKKPVVRDPALDIAQAVAALALDKKADDVVILKVTDLTSYADGFVLASAPSERQVQAIARFVDDEMRKAGKAPVGIEGLEQGHWVLVDLGAIVLHVFLSNARRYYDLEGFWSEAPRVDVDEAYGLTILEKMRAHRQAQMAAAAG